MVSTGGVYKEKLNLSDLNNEHMEPFDGHDCYTRSKVSFIVFLDTRGTTIYFFVKH